MCSTHASWTSAVLVFLRCFQDESQRNREPPQGVPEVIVLGLNSSENQRILKASRVDFVHTLISQLDPGSHTRVVFKAVDNNVHTQPSCTGMTSGLLAHLNLLPLVRPISTLDDSNFHYEPLRSQRLSGLLFILFPLLWGNICCNFFVAIVKLSHLRRVQSLVYFVVWGSNTGSFLHVGKSSAKTHTQPEKKFVLMESHCVTVAGREHAALAASACRVLD